MSRLVALALGLTATVWQGAPAPPSVAGRWRLADAVIPANVAKELLVIESPGRLRVERRFESGVEFASFTVIPEPTSIDRTPSAGRSSAFPNMAVQRGRLLQLKGLAAVQGARAPFAEHEELWSIAPEDFLVVNVTDKSVGGTPKVLRLSYQRVPRPNSSGTPQNLLENANGDGRFAFWVKTGNAVIDPCDGNPCFSVRDSGVFQQHTLLPADAAGKFVVLIGSAMSERINPDGGITGLPNLYALVATEDGTRFVAHLQGQRLLARPRTTSEWVTMSGIFPIPEGASSLFLDLKLASAKGVEHNGSAGRFDDLGAYVLPSQTAARAFVANWRGRSR